MSWAYINGEFLPAEQAVIPVYDAGFVLGVTVAEQMRTFRGRLFRLEQHLARLEHSLQTVDVDPGVALDALAAAARELAEHNHGLLDPEDDLGLSVCVTPGPYLTMRDAVPAAARHGPLVCMHTYPLPFGLWADKYAQGQSLRVTDVRQVPTTCWPPELKCRSRMHYYLADLRARKMEPGARALLLDHDGYALEASTANIVVYREQEGFVSPPHEKILPGISVGVVAELAAGLGIPFRDRDLTVEDLFQADEVMLCSTSPCVWPVFRLNGRPLGQAGGGRICRRLLSDWSALAGVDIPAQAARFAQRRSHV